MYKELFREESQTRFKVGDWFHFGFMNQIPKEISPSLSNYVWMNTHDLLSEKINRITLPLMPFLRLHY